VEALLFLFSLLFSFVVVVALSTSEMPFGVSWNWCRGGTGRSKEGGYQEDEEQYGEQQQQQQQQGERDKIKRMEELGKFYQVNWSKEGFLGRGHFAEVYRAKDLRTGRDVAVKRISRQNQDVKTLRTEVEALLKVQGHPNIVSLYDVFIDDNAVILVMELLEGGELFSRIVEHGSYTEQDASKHIRKITEALRFMHQHGIVHRDLKPENLVLSTKDPDSEIKISDFGLSKVLEGNTNVMYTVCGTSAYAAPEVGMKNNYDNRCDSWSLGVIIFVILASYHPFDPYGRLDDMGLREAVCNYKWDFNDKVWNEMSAAVKDLIRRLLCPAEERLDADQILEHPWIKSFDQLPQKPISQLSTRNLRNFVSSAAILGQVDSSMDLSEDDSTHVIPQIQATKPMDPPSEQQLQQWNSSLQQSQIQFQNGNGSHNVNENGQFVQRQDTLPTQNMMQT